MDTCKVRDQRVFIPTQQYDASGTAIGGFRVRFEHKVHHTLVGIVQYGTSERDGGTEGLTDALASSVRDGQSRRGSAAHLGG